MSSARSDALPRIAIVGAGIGGLSLALALSRQGFAFSVHERANALGEIGAGITLFPNATRALFSLGLKDELRAMGQEFERQSLWHFQTGETLKSYERGPLMWEQYGGPLYGLHRADLHDLLARSVEAAAPGSIHLGRELIEVQQDEACVRLHFANGVTEEADFVIGCDGIKSNVRRALFGESRPRFTGIVAWRALVPMEAVPPSIQADPAGIHVGPSCNFSYYPIRGGTTLNYDAFALADEWTDEGWTVRSDITELLRFFSTFKPEVVELIRATPSEMLHKWGLFDRDVSPRWSVGRVTLLGDAAHPMLPFLGQGSGMAIEDAVVLARILGEDADLATALPRYERARFERANYTTLTGRRHAQAYSTHPDEGDEEEYGMEIDLNAYDAATVPV